MIKKQNDKRKIEIKYKLDEYIDKIYIRAEFKIESEIIVNKNLFLKQKRPDKYVIQGLREKRLNFDSPCILFFLL